MSTACSRETEVAGYNAEARSLKQRYGFTSHKLKGGVFPPAYELECYRALAAAFSGDSFRLDPNGVWSVRGRTSDPLLFDRNGKRKPAFDAIVRLAQQFVL